MNAEIIAVGTELLTSSRLDTNSLYITARLNEIGIAVLAKSVVGDDRAMIAMFVRQALARTDLLILTGGLGPTADDVTRETVAEVLELPLTEDPAIVERLRRRFERRGLRMAELNLRQAQVPAGAVVLDNRNGTAPGLFIEHDGRLVLLLPGPPRELNPMLDAVVSERLASRAGGRRLFRRVLKIAGRTESHVEEIAQPVYGVWHTDPVPVETTILASPGQIELHLTVTCDEASVAGPRLDEAESALVAALGRDVFSVDGRSLEQVVGDLLRVRGWRIGLAESCTGGMMAARLTEVPGSSEYLQGGVVSYGNRAKIELLGVPADLIEEHGAVSEAVAIAMANGARRVLHADVGVGITGIAGPSGGTPAKPVGLVCLAVVDAVGASHVRTATFAGERAVVRLQATQAALDFVRRILEHAGETGR